MMFDYLEMHLDHQRGTVKHNRRAIRMNLGLLAFNLTVFVFDCWVGRSSGSWSSYMGAGAMGMNVIWTFLFLCEYWGEQRHDKEMLHYYEKRKAEKNTEEALAEYRRAKDFYERRLQSEHLGVKPDSVPESDPALQSTPQC